MIKYLRLKNFAVYKDCEIEFDNGLTIITGETGAGKSLLTKALELLMGQQAKTHFIRPDCDHALIEMILDDGQSEWVISRKISPKNSVIKINDSIATLKRCRHIIEESVYLSTQHEQTTHLKPQHHLSFLDHFIGEPIEKLSRIYKTEYESLLSKQQELDQFMSEHQLSPAEQEFMTFQIQDIDQHQFEETEEDELKKMKQQIKTYDQQSKYWKSLQSACYSIKAELDGLPPSPIDDPRVDATVQNIHVHIETLRDVALDQESALNQSEHRDINQIESRLDVIYRYKTKYKVSHLKDLIQLAQDLARKQKRSAEYESECKRQREQIQIQTIRCEEQANKMDQLRIESTKSFETALIKHLQKLDLPDVNVVFKATPTDLHLKGSYQWELTLSYNKGFQPKPIHLLASGGELSRTLLALKMLMHDALGYRCLIFDEIDSGTGGETARKIAETLHILAKESQIICISHQAQIVSVADHHFKILKSNEDDRIASSVITPLSGTERELEYNRMKG